MKARRPPATILARIVTCSGIGVLAGIGILPVAAGADTLPGLTPVEVVADSNCVLLLEFTHVDANGLAVAAVRKVLKGQHDSNEFRVDLLDCPFEAQTKHLMDLIKGAPRQAVLFIGGFPDPLGEQVELKGPDGRPILGADGKPVYVPAKSLRGYVHMEGAPQGSWLELEPPEKGRVWYFSKLDQYMTTAWYGGTDMLVRCVEYVLSDPNAEVPWVEGVEWDAGRRLGRLEGRVWGTAPLDLSGKGQADLFIACEKGDRVFRWDGNGMADVTGKLGLQSKSRSFAWGDFDGDGRLDLASWDGTTVSLHSGRADGTLAAAEGPRGAQMDGVVRLAAMGGGEGPRALLAAFTRGSLAVLSLKADGAWQSQPIASLRDANLGDCVTGLVEDFDNDGLPDVLACFAREVLFFRGTVPGQFGAPVKTSVAMGGSRGAACAGDFDGDGLLDVFATSDANNHLWQNLGGGKFRETFDQSGSVNYITKPGATGAQAGDFNNDGRQDLLVAYASDGNSKGWMSPQLFFNRGFRNLEYAYAGLGLDERRLLPNDAQGHQAVCLGDFDGDGALDMALVLGNGQVWLLPRNVNKGNNRGVVASLPVGGPTAGPVNVQAYAGKRLLGTWSLRAGEPGAIIGARFPGPVTLKWTMPDGRTRQKQAIIRDGPVKVLLEDGV